MRLITAIIGITLIAQAPQQYRIGDIKIVGNKLLNGAVITSILGVASGEVYDEATLRNGLDNVRKLYGTRGYVNFTATPGEAFDEEKKVINLTINIDEDRQFHVGHIVFTGNTTTSGDKIRRELLVKEGQIFNVQNWELSMIRLNQLGYFEPIRGEDTEIKPSPTEPTLDITLHVKEKPRN